MTPTDAAGLGAWCPPALRPDHVYVFGSRMDGLHSVADAGWSFKGTVVADWHVNAAFRAAVNAPDGRGLRAVWGRSEGLQEGSVGRGYAIPSAVDWAIWESNPRERHGMQRGVGMALRRFVEFAREHPTLSFVVGPVGLLPVFGGGGVFTREEMKQLWRGLLLRSRPANITFQPLPSCGAERPAAAVIPLCAPRPRESVVADVSILDLPPGSDPRSLGRPHVFVGHTDAVVSPLSEPSIAVMYRPGSTAAEREQIYRRQLLHHLGRKAGAAAREALDTLARDLAGGPIVLVTVGEPNAVYPGVLAAIARQRILSAAGSSAACP